MGMSSDSESRTWVLPKTETDNNGGIAQVNLTEGSIDILGGSKAAMVLGLRGFINSRGNVTGSGARGINWVQHEGVSQLAKSCSMPGGIFQLTPEDNIMGLRAPKHCG